MKMNWSQPHCPHTKVYTRPGWRWTPPSHTVPLWKFQYCSWIHLSHTVHLSSQNSWIHLSHTVPVKSSFPARIAEFISATLPLCKSSYPARMKMNSWATISSSEIFMSFPVISLFSENFLNNFALKIYFKRCLLKNSLTSSIEPLET